MKKILSFTLLYIISCLPPKACDVCDIYEYKPYETNNYIGLFYHYRKFNGYKHLGQSNSFFANNKMHELDGSGLLFEKRKSDYEKYHTVALRMNFLMWKKYILLIIAPFESSRVYYHKV